MTSSPNRPGRHFANVSSDDSFDPPEGQAERDAAKRAASEAPRHFGGVPAASQGVADPAWAGEDKAEREERVSEAPEDEPLLRPQPGAALPFSAIPECVPGSEGPEKPGKSKKPKKQRSTGAKIVRGILIALLVIVLLLVIAAGVLLLWLNRSMSAGEKKILDASRPSAAANSALADSATADASAQADAPYVPTLDNTITYKGQKYAPNEKMISVAFIGFDNAETGGTVGQADTVIVLTLNLETGAVKAISIPRDTMVGVDEYVGDAYIGQQTMQLCLAYSYGDGSWTSSEHVTSLASRILYDIPISYFFTLNLEGIGPINDAMGGVTLTPLQTIPNTEVYEGVETTLYGDDALRYVRWRDSANPEAETTSSLDRQNRQLQYLQAFASRVMQYAASDPAALVNLYNTAVQYAWTNLGVDEFTYLATQVLQTGLSSLTMTSLPGEMVMGSQYAEFYLDRDGVRQTVIDTFYHPVSAGSAASASSSADASAASAGATVEADPAVAQLAEAAPANEAVPAEGDVTTEEVVPPTEEAMPVDEGALPAEEPVDDGGGEALPAEGVAA